MISELHQKERNFHADVTLSYRQDAKILEASSWILAFKFGAC